MLFSAPMVRAILEGRKTVTRRIVTPQPPADCQAWAGWILDSTTSDDVGKASWHDQAGPLAFKTHHVRCPYGQPGDRMWVRETWYNDAAFGKPEIFYRADGSFDEQFEQHRLGQVGPFKWRPSIHIPRWASRINLEVTGVRVERLQDITEAEALAEGIICENVIVGANCNGGEHQEETADRYFWEGCREEGFETAVEAYADLWDEINGAGAWEANPWVFAVSFNKVEG